MVLLNYQKIMKVIITNITGFAAAFEAMYMSKLSGRNTWHELVANKVPPSTFDVSKFCNDSQYGIDKNYIRIRAASNKTK